MSSPSPFTPTLAHRAGGATAPASHRSEPRAARAVGAPAAGTSVDEPLRLPDFPQPQRRGSLPLLASLVPIAGSVALWLATGSAFMLWFALLGPLIAAATRLDGRRAARRDRARSRTEAASARARVSAQVDERHERERDRLWAGFPDVAGALRAGVVWTSTAERRQSIVVGSGDRPSSVRVVGGDGDPESSPLRARAGVLTGAPVTVPADIGIAVTGPAALAAAVVRALAAQVLVASPPGVVRIVSEPLGENSWLADAPHSGAATGAALAVGVAGEVLPDADIVLLRVPDGVPVPPRCGAVLTLVSIDGATLTVGPDTAPVAVEGLALSQAAELAADLAARATAVFGRPEAAGETTLADLVGADQHGADQHGADQHGADRPGAEEPGAERGRTLRAVVGTAGRTPFGIDLVADGPHAVVVGMTGAGKSELLISLVTALCAAHDPAEVSFLLADFKGGTAFDALRELPQVTGVITDLDGAGARRALRSLSAELRWREAQLVEAGVRDIRDAPTRMPRLVVIVDEFAAMLTEHPELQAVFTDVAARGRALGMHLVLGTQRAAGVLRDALLANCPLRICLRVADPADSRAVIGTEEAASLPGGVEGRGRALIRRAADAGPVVVRIARADPGFVREVASRHAADAAPRRPWLPELPARLTLGDLPPVPAGEIVLGLADDPERQRQTPVLLGERGLCVVGRAGSGRSTALAAIAGQVPDDLRIVVPSDPEGAWDAVAMLASDDPWGDSTLRRGTVVLIDDLDAVLAALPPEYAQAAGERIDRFVRGASGRGIRVVLAAQRLGGVVGRIAEALPRRAILPTGSRMDHIAAGGEANDDLPVVPGRALLDGCMMQWVDAAPLRPSPPAEPAVWSPASDLTGVVVQAGSRSGLARALEERGLFTCTVDEFAEHPRADGPLVVIGDPDAWLRSWRVLGDVRAEHDLIVDVSCAAEYRALTADRELPPYCPSGRALAWLIRPGAAPTRVRLPRR